MTFLEIVREIVLPSVGALAGLGGLIMFIGSRGQRQAETRKTEAEADQIVQLTVGNLHQMTTDAAAAALEAQRGLIDNLQEEIRQVRVQAASQAADFECRLDNRDRKIQELESKVDRLEKELGVREQNIVALEEKLERYEIENERLSQENKSLKKQVESQRKRIKELETQLLIIKKELEKHG